jgi:hypothetical protein
VEVTVAWCARAAATAGAGDENTGRKDFAPREAVALGRPIEPLDKGDRCQERK